jgi:hypothetical protein
MNIAIVIALIALIGSLFSAALTVFGAPIIQQRSEAKKALEKYREPLLDASYELQARLHNILKCGFVERFVIDDDQGRRDSAINSTLYVFAQFFGWREIIRREIRYLQFPEDRKTRQIVTLLREIGDTFLSDAKSYGPQFMIWRVEQRAIGERMIESGDGGMTCMGYASFVERCPEMEKWLGLIKNDLQAINDGGCNRWTKLQHLLLRLVRELDEQKKRYPEPPYHLERA